MLKVIRDSPNLMAQEEYKARAETEWAFLKQEKEKFLDEEAAKQTNINYEMLKVAQDIAKEAQSRVKKENIWDEVDSDAEDEDIGQQPAKEAKPRGKQAKYSDIAKAQEAFPGLDDDAAAEEAE